MSPPHQPFRAKGQKGLFLWITRFLLYAYRSVWGISFPLFFLTDYSQLISVMLTDSALSYSSISVSLCWKTERLRFLTEFLSLLWMAEHRYLNLSNITPCARYFGARQYLRSCWGHGRVSSLPELLLSRPDHSVCTTVEPEKTQRQTAEEMNSKWNFTASTRDHQNFSSCAPSSSQLSCPYGAPKR